jgi:hypothetical protein
MTGLIRCSLVLCAAAWLLAASEHHGVVKFGGLPVPGATVTVTRGNQSFTAVTDPQGAYIFPDLADGTWMLEIEMPGFAPIKEEIAVVPQAPSPEWELKMLSLDQMHATAAPATPAASPAVQTTNAAQAKPIAQAAKPGKRGKGGPPAPTNTSTAFQRADLNAANPNAGATPANEAVAPSGDAAELSQRAADGLLINGTTNNGASSPFAQAAAFGNNRRGARSLYSGNIGFIMDNSALDARQFSLTGQDTPKLAYNNFEGVAAFGGPLTIPGVQPQSRPQFFVNYQWIRNRNDSTLSGLVPDAAQRAGDFSGLVNPFGQPITIFDPLTHTPFAGNIIPASRINSQAQPQAQALLNLYPLPNFAGGTRYNYQVPEVNITHQDNLQSRVNKLIGRKNQVSGLFAMQSTRADNPNLFGFLDTNDSLGLNLNLNWRHNVTQRFFMNFGLQYSRQSLRTNPYFANRQNVSGEAQISGNNQEPINWGPPALNFTSGIQALTDSLPSFTRNQTSGVSSDNLWNRSRHNVSFGAGFRRQDFNLLSQQDPRGQFTFTGAATGASAQAPGSDFADFLLGVPDTSSIAFGNADKYFRANSYNAYVVDDWRMSPGFTLNAGLRWEYWSPISEKYGRLVNLDVTGPFSAVAPVVATNPTGSLTGTSYPSSLIRPDRRAFQPRVGFSWRPLPASSMVVRGGYGIYYNTSVYLPIVLQMAQQAPLSKSLIVPNSASNPLTLANGFNVSPAVTPDTFGVDPNLRIGYSQNWQLSVQRDLPGSLVMIAMYQGSKGTHGLQEFLPNTYPEGAANACSGCPAGFYYMTSNGTSSREAGQIQLRRRLHNGLAASLQYTLAKAIDDDALLGGSGLAGPGGQGGQGAPGGQGPGGGGPSSSSGARPPGSSGAGQAAIAQNWLNLAAERSLSNFDQRHTVSIQAQYTTGMGVRGGTLVNGWRGALFKQWTFMTQINAGTGLPLTPVYPAPVSGTGVTGPVRPQYTGAPLYGAPGGLFLNPAAFVPPPPGQWGNAGRNSITGPTQFSLNASLGRTFALNDRLSLDVRFDSTNALNHVTFPSWNTTVNNQQFGLPMTANAMRVIQTNLRLRF